MKEQLKIPTHIGIILDGNGRWAKKRGLPRSMGHKAGFDNLKKLNLYIFKQGVKILSIYAFSTENFNRPPAEVDGLMKLLVNFCKNEAKFYQKENIKIIFSGRKDNLSKEVLDAIEELTENTKNNDGAIFNICFNYGSHFEIIDAFKKIYSDISIDKLSINNITPDIVNNYLYNSLPPIDLVIRTSGEYRLSNFMLWQISYAEFYFTNTYFPDFNEREFDIALLEYTKRDRRFGGIINENENN